MNAKRGYLRRYTVTSVTLVVENQEAIGPRREQFNPELEENTFHFLAADHPCWENLPWSLGIFEKAKNHKLEWRSWPYWECSEFGLKQRWGKVMTSWVAVVTFSISWNPFDINSRCHRKYIFTSLTKLEWESSHYSCCCDSEAHIFHLLAFPLALDFLIFLSFIFFSLQIDSPLKRPLWSPHLHFFSDALLSP